MPKKNYTIETYKEVVCPEQDIKINYTQAIIEYKKWKFIISPEKWPSVNPDMTFEIKVLHDDLYWDDMYLTNTWMWYNTPYRITSFDDAVEKVKDFIRNELK